MSHFDLSSWVNHCKFFRSWLNFVGQVDHRVFWRQHLKSRYALYLRPNALIVEATQIHKSITWEDQNHDSEGIKLSIINLRTLNFSEKIILKLKMNLAECVIDLVHVFGCFCYKELLLNHVILRNDLNLTLWNIFFV